MTESSTARPARPGMQHRRLDGFVGTWRTAGTVRASEHGPATPFTAIDRYEWMPGGFFLLHHVQAHMGEGELTALEVISYDPETNTYPMRSFDSQGNTGTHQATLRDRTWTFQGPTERFTGSFSDDGGTITGLWEQSADGVAWVPWMDVTLTRQD